MSRWWIVGVIVYACVLAFIGWTPLKRAFESVTPGYFIAMAATMAASLWLRALKWRWALGPRRHAAGLFFLSKAAGGYSPSRVGEFAPLLLKNHRTPRLAAWIVLDRLLETGATVGLGIAGCVALGMPQRAVWISFALAFLLLVIAPYLLLTRTRLFAALCRILPAGSAPHRLCAALLDVTGEIKSFRGITPVAAAWSVGCTALDLLVALFLYAGFGHMVPFSLLAVVQCAHGLASALPFLPNATGGPYLVAAGLLYKFAAVPENVLAAAIGVNVALSNVFGKYL